VNLKQEKYSCFALVREMLQTAEVVAKLPVSEILTFATRLEGPRVFLSGEGSSRIFPAQNLIYKALVNNYQEIFFSEGATQALEYQLATSNIFLASNSGKTKEVLRLLRHLKAKRQAKAPPIFALVANAGTPIASEADYTYFLSCGPEEAVAATKSVVEQALFYDLLFCHRNNLSLPDLKRLSQLLEEVLTCEISPELIEPLIAAKILYFAGRNNGVAEELRLKTNEITRKKSDYLEGTYAVHGIEEVMQPDEAVILIEPFAEEEDKLREVLSQGVGIKVVAIASRPTSFPTLLIPNYPGYESFLQLAAGWNLLVEIGVSLGINLDRPQRARKVGNEFQG